jgi:DNA topoisomerase IB
MVRLRRTSPSRPGWTRQRSGTGFIYLDEHAGRIGDPEVIAHLRALAIPPAWQKVWICPHPNGHLQAVGTDDRGRRQYLYHPQWHQWRNQQKHTRILHFARRLPAARARVNEHLALPGMPRERTLAAAFRLLDIGLFRIGGESYAEQNGSYGLATLHQGHVSIRRHAATFEYRAKSGQQRSVEINDPALLPILSALKRRRTGGQELLAWRQGRRWIDVTSDDINTYIKTTVDPRSSAKDFRTWHATVLAAITLADAPIPRSPTAMRRTVSHAIHDVAAQLGNTPAVCRASYIDPRVIDRFEEGATIRAVLRRVRADAAPDPEMIDPAIERAVLRLLRA